MKIFKIGSPSYTRLRQWLCWLGLHSYTYYNSIEGKMHVGDEPCNCDRRECPYCDIDEPNPKKKG